jgi:hypothetical protein
VKNLRTGSLNIQLSHIPTIHTLFQLTDCKRMLNFINIHTHPPPAKVVIILEFPWSRLSRQKTFFLINRYSIKSFDIEGVYRYISDMCVHVLSSFPTSSNKKEEGSWVDVFLYVFIFLETNLIPARGAMIYMCYYIQSG